MAHETRHLSPRWDTHPWVALPPSVAETRFSALGEPCWPAGKTMSRVVSVRPKTGIPARSRCQLRSASDRTSRPQRLTDRCAPANGSSPRGCAHARRASGDCQADDPTPSTAREYVRRRATNGPNPPTSSGPAINASTARINTRTRSAWIASNESPRHFCNTWVVRMGSLLWLRYP